MPALPRPLTPGTAVAVRDPRGVVHPIGGFVAAVRIIGPACMPFVGNDGALGAGWWRQDDCELLGPEAAVTCLWCAACWR